VSIDGSGRKKFVSATLSNGTDIELGKVYRGVMIDSELIRKKDNELIFKVKNAKDLGSLIELIAQELMKIKVIR
jgi:N-acetylmuramic acid 6-phosphate (MurNAc-6-P) etherase